MRSIKSEKKYGENLLIHSIRKNNVLFVLMILSLIIRSKNYHRATTHITVNASIPGLKMKADAPFAMINFDLMIFVK